MEVKEIRIVVQEWYETDTTKTGWDSHGWSFRDDGLTMDESKWTIINHIDSDKHYNPIMGIAEKVTKLF